VCILCSLSLIAQKQSDTGLHKNIYISDSNCSRKPPLGLASAARRCATTLPTPGCAALWHTPPGEKRLVSSCKRALCERPLRRSRLPLRQRLCGLGLVGLGRRSAPLCAWASPWSESGRARPISLRLSLQPNHFLCCDGQPLSAPAGRAARLVRYSRSLARLRGLRSDREVAPWCHLGAVSHFSPLRSPYPASPHPAAERF